MKNRANASAGERKSVADMRECIQNGEMLRRVGKAQLAMHTFARGAREFPDARWQFLYYMGSCCLDLGKYEKAAKFYLQAWTLNPGCAGVWAAVAECAIHFNQLEEAVEMISHALRLDERCANAWIAWGELHEAREEFEKAAKCHETALKVDPDCTRALARAGFALRSLGLATGDRGCFERAETMFRAYLEHWPGDESQLFNLGLVYGNLGRFKEAAETFAKIIELNPEDLEAKKYQDLSLQDLAQIEAGHVSNV
ncbi:MAG: tetratricopeptide repeat protein [Nitrospirae bacterium]|nr:tetratricopeptide repeat protein [Nitrospirota bacterium]